MNGTTDADAEAFIARVAQLRDEHANRSNMEGILRSRAAFLNWGEPIPAALAICTRDELVKANREHWLRDAECVIRTLDHRAFANGTFHVIDGQAIGMPDRGYLGMAAAAHLHKLAADYLPRTARNPVAAVAVHVDAVARNTIGTLCDGREEASRKVRAVVACIAAHEYAHHVVAEVEGETIPPTASIEGTIKQLRAGTRPAGHSARVHGARWCRAYGHLLKRAAFLPHHDLWVDRFRADIKAATKVDPDAVLDSLHSEFARFTFDDLLADVLRSPAPAGFTGLFDERGAARSAMETRNDGSVT